MRSIALIILIAGVGGCGEEAQVTQPLDRRVQVAGTT